MEGEVARVHGCLWAVAVCVADGDSQGSATKACAKRMRGAAAVRVADGESPCPREIARRAWPAMADSAAAQYTMGQP